MMGPVNASRYVCGLLGRVADNMMVPQGELGNARLHSASVALRVAVIDQTLALLELTTPSTSHNSGDQP
jgi:hypothetical protein